MLSEATCNRTGKGREKNLFGSHRVYNVLFIRRTTRKCAKYGKQLAAGFSRAVVPSKVPPTEKASFAAVLSPRSNLGKCFGGYTRHDLAVFWVNRGCFGPAVFIYEIPLLYLL